MGRIVFLVSLIWISCISADAHEVSPLSTKNDHSIFVGVVMRISGPLDCRQVLIEHKLCDQRGVEERWKRYIIENANYRYIVLDVLEGEVEPFDVVSINSNYPQSVDFMSIGERYFVVGDLISGNSLNLDPCRILQIKSQDVEKKSDLRVLYEMILNSKPNYFGCPEVEENWIQGKMN